MKTANKQTQQKKKTWTYTQKWIKNNHCRKWHGFARDFFWNHLPFIPVKEVTEQRQQKTVEKQIKWSTMQGNEFAKLLPLACVLFDHKASKNRLPNYSSYFILCLRWDDWREKKNKATLIFELPSNRPLQSCHCLLCQPRKKM